MARHGVGRTTRSTNRVVTCRWYGQPFYFAGGVETVVDPAVLLAGWRVVVRIAGSAMRLAPGPWKNDRFSQESGARRW